MSAVWVVRAWLELLYVDLIGLRGFQAVLKSVGRRPDCLAPVPENRVSLIADAVDRAVLLYVKPVLCLQRSAVLTRLLRREGADAELVIGCHLCPFTAHAWVEVAGRTVADDTPYIPFLAVLDRW